MESQVEPSRVLHEMVEAGEAALPLDAGMPDQLAELAAGVESLSDLLIAERDDERRR
jgi:hypothetical protein